MSLAYCEPVTAGPLAPWCIRKLSDVGLKTTGGVDTPSLCGRVKPFGRGKGELGGWDLRVPVDLQRPANLACKKCLSVLEAAENAK